MPADERASARSRSALIEVPRRDQPVRRREAPGPPGPVREIRGDVGDRPPDRAMERDRERGRVGARARRAHQRLDPGVRGLGFKSEGSRLIQRAGVPFRSASRTFAPPTTWWQPSGRFARRARTRRASSSSTTTRRGRRQCGPRPWPDGRGRGSEAGSASSSRPCPTGTAPISSEAASSRSSSQAIGSRARAPRSTSGPAAASSSSPPTSRCSAASGPGVPGLPFPGRPGVCPRAGPPRRGVGELLAAAGRAWTVLCRLRRGRRWRSGGVARPRPRDQPPQGRHHPSIRGDAECRPGRYDAEPGRWLTEDGGSAVTARRTTSSTRVAGSVACRRHRGRCRRWSPVRPRTGTGVVLHMLSGLAIDGRFGLTAIGETPDEAAGMHEVTSAAVAGLV